MSGPSTPASGRDLLTAHRFIFVGGLHRSGTTLLARQLARHPDVSGLRDTRVPEDEGQHLQAVYPPAARYGGPGRFGFAPQMHVTESSPLASPANRTRLLDAWRPYWDSSRPVLLEKSPPNLLKTRFLQAMFPGALQVVIMRHPVAVALATRKWTEMTVPELVDHWLHCHDTFIDDVGHLGNAALVRYEELITRPEPVLAALWSAVGLGPEPAAVEVRPGLNERYFDAWSVDEGRGRDLALLTSREPRMARYGYCLREPHRAVQPAPEVASVLVP